MFVLPFAALVEVTEVDRAARFTIRLLDDMHPRLPGRGCPNRHPLYDTEADVFVQLSLHLLPEVDGDRPGIERCDWFSIFIDVDPQRGG